MRLKTSLPTTSLLFVSFLLAILLAGFISRTQAQQRTRAGRRSTGAGASSTAAPQADPFPILATKPEPSFDEDWICPPEGDAKPTSQSDMDLNRLKNRVDEGAFKAVSIPSILALKKPVGVCGKNRRLWSQNQKEAIQQFEGTPVVIEGFLALVKNNAKLEGARKEGPESCNCHGDEDQSRDFHIWVLPEPGASRAKSSVVVEMSPPVRAHHPKWTVDNLTVIANAGQRVRVSGWLLFDQEHCNEVGNSRGTVWEIHPVIKFERFVNGQWRKL